LPRRVIPVGLDISKRTRSTIDLSDLRRYYLGDDVPSGFSLTPLMRSLMIHDRVEAGSDALAWDVAQERQSRWLPRWPCRRQHRPAGGRLVRNSLVGSAVPRSGRPFQHPVLDQAVEAADQRDRFGARGRRRDRPATALLLTATETVTIHCARVFPRLLARLSM